MLKATLLDQVHIQILSISASMVLLEEIQNKNVAKIVSYPAFNTLQTFSQHSQLSMSVTFVCLNLLGILL